MHEISPVLAGTFDAPDYATARANFNLPAPDASTDVPSVTDASSTSSAASSASSTSSVSDSQRYSKWDHQASQVADASMSFDDFLDMVNPLQHIPVVSSIYRGIENQDINPVSRIVGDMMYGGIFGVASAALGGVGAVADSMMVASTGRDTSGSVLASLFDADDKKDTQLAQNNPASNPAVSATMAAASAAAYSPQSSSPVIAAALSTPSNTDVQAGLPLQQAKMYPLNPNTKLPYGGVMAPPSIEAQNTAIALSQASHSMRLGNMIYTNPLMNGPHPLPVAVSQPAASLASDTNATTTAALPSSTQGAVPMASPATSNTDASKAGPQASPIPQNLVDDMIMMHALKQYQGVASGPSSTGSTLDVTN